MIVQYYRDVSLCFRMNTSDKRVFNAEICELIPGRLFQLGTVVNLSLLCSSVICSSDRIILCSSFLPSVSSSMTVIEATGAEYGRNTVMQ